MDRPGGLSLEIGHLRGMLARQILLDFFFQMLYPTGGGF